MCLFSCSGSHKVHSFTRDMHRRVKERRARRIADRKNADREDAEPEEGSKGEMDNFQDLQLGSLSPVVRCRRQFALTFYRLTALLQDMERTFVL